MLEQVARETGAAIVYGNHFSKGNQAAKEAIDRISGAGAGRDPDTIITLTKHESDGAYTVECTLRKFPPIEPFCVRWEYPLFVQDRSLDPGKLKQVTMGRKARWTVEQLVECLGNKDLKSSDFQKLVYAEIGMPRATFFELLPKAKDQGLLHRCVTADIDFWSASPNAPQPLRSRGYACCVVDEAAHYSINLRDTVDAAIRPALALAEGKLLFISTPEGRNDFYTYFLEAQRTGLALHGSSLSTLTSPTLSTAGCNA